MHLDSQFDIPENDRPTILPLYGGAKKSVCQMSKEEFDEVAQIIYVKVREQAFSRGLPVIIERNGQAVKEFADGRFEPIIPSKIAT